MREGLNENGSRAVRWFLLAVGVFINPTAG
jgi:hypothetical protein